MVARPIVNVSARYFSAALICASKEETYLPVIQGVHIEQHPERGALLVSTDGRRLLVIHDPDGKCGKALTVSADKMLRAAAGKSQDADRMLVSKAGMVEIPGRYKAENICLIDAVYPTWTHLVHQVRRAIVGNTRAFGTFNPSFLGDFEKIAKKLGAGDSSSRAIRLVTPDDTGASMILFPRFDHAFALTMPMHYPDAGSALPIWMKPVLAAKPAKSSRSGA